MHRQGGMTGAISGFFGCPMAILALSLCSTFNTSSLATIDEPAQPSLASQVNESLGLESSSLQSVEMLLQENGHCTARVHLAGQERILQLEPHSIRAPGFKVRAQMADGSWVVHEGPDKTVRGSVEGFPGAHVAGSLLEGGLYASVVYPDGERFWIEPIAERFGTDDPSMHVIYTPSEVLPHGRTCAVEGMAPDAILNDQEPAQVSGGIAGNPFVCIAEVATDADVEYFNDYGSVQAVQDRIMLVINTMNIQYETQIGITHQLTEMLVRTAEPDPYTSFASGSLLCEFITEWTNNQQAIQRDVAQLFTGRDINGGTIGQAADIGATGICQNQGSCTGGQFGTQGSYSQVQSDFNNNFGCATDLSAHEFGHLWGAFHCSCPGNTMNPSITCANVFSAGVVGAITSYLETRECVDCAQQVAFSLPDGVLDFVDPNGGSTIVVEVEPDLGQPASGSGMVHFRINGGPFNVQPMNEVSPNVYEAQFPMFECADIVEYYFSAQSTGGITVTEPLGAPDDTFSAIAGSGTTNAFFDNFNGIPQNWTVQNSGLTDGAWQIGVPVDCNRGDPPTDADGSGACQLTDNSAANNCNSDVDGGSTTLVSPIMNASLGTAVISYYRWFSNDAGDNAFTETFTVEVSDDGGATWSILEVVGPAGGEVSGGWFEKAFNIEAAGIEANDQFRIRFTTQDFGAGSVVEAGVDGVRLLAVDCGKVEPTCDADVTGDGEVDVQDLVELILNWGACPGCPADINDDDRVDVEDLVALILAWGDCP